MPSVTSSFRMSKYLQRALSDAAERTGKGKNAIIIEALAKYLSAMERQSLAEEAEMPAQVGRSRHAIPKRDLRPALIHTHGPGFVQKIETIATPTPGFR